MFMDKDEVEAQGQKFIEPSVGVPIKKRPFNLNAPSIIQSDPQSLDKLSFSAKHVTPKSLLDFASSPCFSNGNNNNNNFAEKPSSSNSNNNLDKSCTNLGLEIPRVVIAPELQSSVVKKEKLDNNCSTDLSLTGNRNPGSSKIQNLESLNCSGRRAALDLNVDLNVAFENWEENNGVAPAQQPLVKQGSTINMECNGNVPKESVKNLSFSAVGNRADKSSLGDVTLDLQLKLPPRPELRMKNSDVWSSDLSLSLSGKDLDCNNSNISPKSDIVKSQVAETSKGNCRNSSSTNLSVTVSPVGQKEVIVKKELNERNANQQENGSNNQDMGSNSLVKKELIENNQVSLGGKLQEKSFNNGIDLNQTASGIINNNPVVTKSVSIGLAVTKSSTSDQVGASVIQPAVTKSNTSMPAGGPIAQPAVTKSKTSVPAGLVAQPPVAKINTSVPAGLVAQPSIAKATSLPAGLVTQASIAKINATVQAGLAAQPSIAKSNQSHDNSSGSNTTNIRQNATSLVPTSLPIVGNSSQTEDIKPVITSASLINNNAKLDSISKAGTVPIASEGLSQGSADMDCSEENHTLPKLPTSSDKSKETVVNNLHGSCSSILSKTPKLEPGFTAGNCAKELEEKTTGNGESSKSLGPSTFPNENEMISCHNHVESNNYDNGLDGDKSEMPSNCPNLRQMNILALSNKPKQSFEMDRAVSSKSRSPSLSGKRDSSNSRRDNNSTSDRDIGLERGNNEMEREIGSSSRQFAGEGSNNNYSFQRRFKRSDCGFDRPNFERKKSRVSQWDEGPNNRPNRGLSLRWEPRRYNKFDTDRIKDQNEDTGFRPGSNNRPRSTNIRYNKNNNNRFNQNRNNSRGGGFRFTRQNNSNNNTDHHSDVPFHSDESNRRAGPRPCLSRFQSRRRLADVSPREADEMDSPVFDHPNNNNNSNHYGNNKRVDHAVTCNRERSFSPLPRRGNRHWTPPVEMLTGHNEVLNRRPYYNNKDCTNRRHLSSNNNRPLHRNNNNNNNNRRFVGPALGGEPFEPPMHFDDNSAVLHYHHVRYCSDDDDVAFSDGGAPPVRGRNRQNNNNMRRQAGGDQQEYRYNNNRGGPHGWRDGNNNNNNAGNNSNNNGDKLKRRRY